MKEASNELLQKKRKNIALSYFPDEIALILPNQREKKEKYTSP